MLLDRATADDLRIAKRRGARRGDSRSFEEDLADIAERVRSDVQACGASCHPDGRPKFTSPHPCPHWPHNHFAESGPTTHPPELSQGVMLTLPSKLGIP